MSLKTLEIKWKPALFSILEELTEPQYRKLLFNLAKIPQGVKGGKVKEEIPQIIIQYFGAEGSISVIDKEMRQIPRMDAAVQDLLRPFVDKLKKQRQKNKGTTSKLATDSGSVAKRQKTAAGTTSKLAADSGSVAKRQKLAADQQKSCQPAKTDPAGPVKPKQKKTKMPDLSLKPAGSTKLSETDPAGPVKPKQKKTKMPDLSLKPAGSTKISEVQSAAVQTGKIKEAAKKDSDMNSHLEAEFNNFVQSSSIWSQEIRPNFWS